MRHLGCDMNPTKPCPYCGEEILAVAVKCKHCGSTLNGPASAARSQFGMRPGFVIAGAVIVILMGVGSFLNWSKTGTLSGHGFTDQDVVHCEQNIRDEFAKRGVKVEDVTLLKKSPTELAGFVKLRVPLLGNIQKSCTATMGEDGQYLWKCQ